MFIIYASHVPNWRFSFFSFFFIFFSHTGLRAPSSVGLLLTKMGKARKDLGKLARRAAHQIKGTQPVGWASFIFPSPPIYYISECARQPTSSRQPSVLTVAILLSCVPGSEERAQKRRVLVHGRCAAIGEFAFGKRLLFSSFLTFHIGPFLFLLFVGNQSVRGWLHECCIQT